MINSNINTYICNKYIERKNIKIQPNRIENLKKLDSSAIKSLRSYSIQNIFILIFVIIMMFAIYFITEESKRQEEYNEFNSLLILYSFEIIFILAIIWLLKSIINNEIFAKKIKVEIKNDRKEIYEIKSSSSTFYNNLEGVGSFYSLSFEGIIDTFLMIHESQLPQIKGEEFILEILPISGLILNIQNKKIIVE